MGTPPEMTMQEIARVSLSMTQKIINIRVRICYAD
jgi:hypothetical protein